MGSSESLANIRYVASLYELLNRRSEEVELVETHGSCQLPREGTRVLATSEDVDDVIEYMRSNEKRYAVSDPEYMSKQEDIDPSMREILVDWLVAVAYEFNFTRETLFLTVNYLDRFLEKRSIHRTRLQLVGITCMFLAHKYEEVKVKDIWHFARMTDEACDESQMRKMEREILQTLEFHLAVSTSLAFAEAYMVLLKIDDRDIEALVYFYLEMTLQYIDSVKYPPSLLASSALYRAWSTITRRKNKEESWTVGMADITGYTRKDIIGPSNLFNSLIKKTGASKEGCRAVLNRNQSIVKKYLSPRPAPEV